MISYIKLAFKVLLRRKFFTFISLFGISLTLAVLMIVSSFLDTSIGKNPPLSNHDKMMFLSRVEMQLVVQDTVYQIDSSFIDGKWAFDSTLVVNDAVNSNSNSDAGYDLLDSYMREVPSASNYSFYNNGQSYDVYLKNQRLTLRAKAVDAAYWEVFDFEFLEGRPFDHGAMDRSDQVVIMAKTAGDEYFGNYKDAIGQDVDLDGKMHEVIGVVDDVTESNRMVHADIYMPYALLRSDNFEKGEYLGGWGAAFVAAEGRTAQDIMDDLHAITPNISLPNPEDYNKIILHPMNVVDRFSRIFVDYDDDLAKMRRQFILGMLVIVGMFILLPTLNLVNINLTRIFERSAEIGVRKAFGATTGNLVFQFVFENLVLTFLGGFLGLFLSFVGIQYINKYQLIPYTTLDFNPIVFIYGFLICILFGIVSGVYPSMKMSRLSIINALKSNNR